MTSTTDRIDIHNYKGKLQRELRRLMTEQDLRAEHRQAIYRFIIGASSARGDRRRYNRKRVSDGRCIKLIWHLRRFAREMPVPFEEVTPEQMERFIVGLERGTITKRTGAGAGEPYAGDTVTDFQKIIRQFYRWLIGHDTVRFEELTAWFDTSERPPELRTFGLDEARRMARSIGSPQGAALVMAMFDGGFRPSELFNVRLRDIAFTADDAGELAALVRIRFSKTKPRTISLPLATDDLAFWLARHPGGGPVGVDGAFAPRDPDATAFTWSYRYAMRRLREVGKAELNERVYPYRFRHASASFYARYLTEYQMCARYGWVMGSTAVRRYIDHSGVLQADTASIVRAALGDQALPSPASGPSIGPIRHSPHQGAGLPPVHVERTIRPRPEPHPAAVRHREHAAGAEDHL